MRSTRALAAVALSAALVLGACGDGEDGTSTEPAAQDGAPAGGDTTVILENLKFKPATVNVSKGSTVTWEWDDNGISHNVVFEDDGPKSKLKGEGTFEHTFEETGTFDYVCTVHPTMKGTVKVS